MHYLKALVALNKGEAKKGIYSVCSANEYVILAAMESALAKHEHLLVEATANQVNQFGGYTGMAPNDFFSFVQGLAARTGFPADRLILGGDHLGPLTWAKEPEAGAMKKAEELTRLFAAAGFGKIHIDTSMHLADDDASAALPNETVAKRGARLAKAAESGFDEYAKASPDAQRPVYIVGSEVPIPGGARETESGVSVTKPEDFAATVAA
ncbi:MAG: class II D-tagatose-bisphosphate aldolase, non-catalytic subunit, partial [Clostridiales Family XIII bacterium]|nr:class II D-tagatose-bisphosphate aldolase, non-catalytic subunit [Clostridiales Family XIII bacterium]